MDNEIRPKRGVVVSLLDEGNGRSRLIMDDVRSQAPANPTTWMFDAFFTQKTFDNGALDSMTLTDDVYRDIGIAVVVRLLALSGRTK
jgi:hypothetical protein